MAWLNGVTDLTSVANGLKSGAGGAVAGDYVTLGAGLATALGKGVIYAMKQKIGDEVAKKTYDTLAKEMAKGAKMPTPTYIVDCAAFVISIVDFLLNGLGAPDMGTDQLKAAKAQFSLFTMALDPSCKPDSRDWSGTAATAYIAQVDKLKGYIAEVASNGDNAFDDQFQKAVTSQGSAVKRAHLTATVNVAVLTAAAGIALILFFQPWGGPGVSYAWQVIAAFACCAAVFVIEMMTLANSMEVNNTLTKLATDYTNKAQDVTEALKGEFGKISGKVADQTSSQVSGFAATSDRLAENASEAPPSLSKTLAAAGDKATPEQKQFLAAAEQVSSKTSTDTSEKKTDDKETQVTPVTPSFSPPSMAQMGQMSQGLNQLGQTFGQGAQQISQMAQSAKGSAPAAAPAALVDDVKDDPDAKKDADDKKKDEAVGAASGTDGTERAPVDASAPAPAAAPAGRERVV